MYDSTVALDHTDKKATAKAFLPRLMHGHRVRTCPDCGGAKFINADTSHRTTWVREEERCLLCGGKGNVRCEILGDDD